MKYSASKENYLKAIYHLQSESDTVSTNALAAALNTRAASVTDMLKKLKLQKLLVYEKYQGSRLTPEGRKAALQIIRKHRLWECFLVDKLHFGWDEVHEMAEELEHSSSRKMIDRLEEYLGFPQTDPHGDPIPDKNGKVAVSRQVSLINVPTQKIVEVAAIAQQTTGLLELLEHKQILIGTKLSVRKRFPFDNSLELKIRNKPAVTISEQLAKNIFVKDDKS